MKRAAKIACRCGHRLPVRPVRARHHLVVWLDRHRSRPCGLRWRGRGEHAATNLWRRKERADQSRCPRNRNGIPDL